MVCCYCNISLEDWNVYHHFSVSLSYLGHTTLFHYPEVFYPVTSVYTCFYWCCVTTRWHCGQDTAPKYRCVRVKEVHFILLNFKHCVCGGWIFLMIFGWSVVIKCSIPFLSSALHTVYIFVLAEREKYTEHQCFSIVAEFITFSCFCCYMLRTRVNLFFK